MPLLSKNSLASSPLLWRYLLIILAVVPVVIFLYNPNQLLLEHHAYRQTQTALTTYWIIHGGFKLDYVTPVLGYPWSVPLEFPIYQIIVASLVEVTGWPIDITGRGVSLVFYYLTFIPVFYILRPYGFVAIGICCSVLLTSPIEIFFSRAFSIETLATFISLSALAFYFNYLRSNKLSSITLFVIFGSVAALQKVTTFAPVIMVCVVNELFYAVCERHKFMAVNKRRPWLILLMCASMIVPVIWTGYSDKIKQLGYLSSFVTSSAMHDWVFGTLSTRLNIEYWLKVFGYRLIFLGGFVVVAIWLINRVRKYPVRISREAIVLIGIGLSGPLIFAPLFYVHDYYLMASIVFLACGLAIAITNYIEQGDEALYIKTGTLVAIVVVVNFSIFMGKYYEMLSHEPSIDRMSYKVARYLNSKVAPNNVIVIDGLDWNSTIPYYSERYALMFPTWIPMHSSVISNPTAFIGQRKIGAIVHCNTALWPSNLTKNEIANLFKIINGAETIMGSCRIKIAQGQ